MLTSPRSRSILKLRLLILSCGEPGKHTMQFVNEYTTSRKYEPSDIVAVVGVGLRGDVESSGQDSYAELLIDLRAEDQGMRNVHQFTGVWLERTRNRQGAIGKNRDGLTYEDGIFVFIELRSRGQLR